MVPLLLWHHCRPNGILQSISGLASLVVFTSRDNANSNLLLRKPDTMCGGTTIHNAHSLCTAPDSHPLSLSPLSLPPLYSLSLTHTLSRTLSLMHARTHSHTATRPC